MVKGPPVSVELTPSLPVSVFLTSSEFPLPARAPLYKGGESDSMVATRDVTRLTNELVDAHRTLGHASMSDHRGHISARLPGSQEILIKARLDKEIPNLESVTRRHIVRMTMDGKVVRISKNLVPPGEYFIHTWIYKQRPDVTAVAHIHPRYTIALGIAGKGIRPVYHIRDATIVAKELPIFEDPRLVTDDQLGRKLAETLGDREACVLRWHGLVTVGKSVREATLRAMKVETQARYNFMALQAGGLREIPETYIGSAAENTSQLDADWAYFAKS